MVVVVVVVPVVVVGIVLAVQIIVWSTSLSATVRQLVSATYLY